MNDLTRFGAIALVVAAITVSPAEAASPPADFSLNFSTTQPGAAADAALHILYRDPENPDDPESQPPALTEVRIEAPAGTVFDGSAPPACTASDGEIQLMGRSACPAETIVADGFGVVEDTSPAHNRYDLEAVLYNAGDAVIEVFFFPGTDQVAAVDRARFESPSTQVLHPAVIPGITEREFQWTYLGIPPAATAPFVKTPPRCPRSGDWEARLEYEVTTGARYEVADTTPCKRPPIGVALSPDEVRAGDRVRIGVTLSSRDPRCISGAAVRLDGGGPVRSDASGRAEIVAEPRKPGLRRVSATKPGCRRGKAPLSVSGAGDK